MSASKIVVKRFWTKYKPNPAKPDEMIGEDWVEYGPLGQLDRSVNEDKISRLRALRPLADSGDNPAMMMAHARWDSIRPRYEAWKQGQEMPESGTPLAAWNAVTPEQAEAFKMRGIRTIEEVAGLTDAHFERLPIPNMRVLVKQAQLYLESADTRKVAAHLESRDGVIESLKQENSDQKAQIASLMEKIDALADLVAKQGVPNDDDAADEKPAPRRKKAA